MKTNNRRHVRTVIRELLIPIDHVSYDKDDSYKIGLVEENFRVAQIFDLMLDHRDGLDAEHSDYDSVLEAYDDAIDALAIYFDKIRAIRSEVRL